MLQLNNQKGQAMVEYGIIVALVALVAISSLGLLGTNVRNLFQDASDALTLNEAPDVISPGQGITVSAGTPSRERVE